MRKTRLGLTALGVAALAWRLAALIDAANSPLLDEGAGRGDIALVVARGLMGLVFLLCGATVLKHKRSRRSALFVLYAFCAAIHWGGPLSAASEQLQLAIWLLYFTVSAMLAQSAFLHFTLVFPEPWSWGRRHATRFLIYLPVALGSVAAALAALSAPDSASEAWRDKFFILEGLQANSFALASLMILVVRWARARPQDGPRAITSRMALGAWVSVLPWVVALSLESAGVRVPGGSDSYTLSFVLLPLVCTWAILRHKPAIRASDL
jgi:hypothetical protein